MILRDRNGKYRYRPSWCFDEKNFLEATAQIPYDWDRVEAFLKLLGELDFTRCIGGNADDMSREMLPISDKRTRRGISIDASW